MAVHAIDPGSIPGGDQFFNPCTFSKKEIQWRSINIGYAPILLIFISHIYIIFKKELSKLYVLEKSLSNVCTIIN